MKTTVRELLEKTSIQSIQKWLEQDHEFKFRVIKTKCGINCKTTLVFEAELSAISAYEELLLINEITKEYDISINGLDILIAPIKPKVT